MYYAGRRMDNKAFEQDKQSPEEKNWLYGMNFPYFAAEEMWAEYLESLEALFEACFNNARFLSEKQ